MDSRVKDVRGKEILEICDPEGKRRDVTVVRKVRNVQELNFVGESLVVYVDFRRRFFNKYIKGKGEEQMVGERIDGEN